MHYEGHIIRPPSEASSILLQVTVGCSHNKCTFCGAYRGQRFKIKPEATVQADIAFASRHCRRQRRVFLCDGDALILPQKRLVPILAAIRTQLPWVTRVGLYANAKSLKMKSLPELMELHALGVGILYMGLESGDDDCLKRVCKGVGVETMIREAHKVASAGIKLSVTVLLGIAGPEHSQRHARRTGRVLSAMHPNYVGALSLMPIPNTPLFEAVRQGAFTLLSPVETLRELRTMIDHTRLQRGLFHANHASNVLPIRARLPKDKEATLALIDAAMNGRIALRPEWARAL